MLEDPGIDTQELALALRTGWAIEASAFTFIAGYDMRAASFAVATSDAPVFLKVHFEPTADARLEVPRALLDAGVSNVMAPLRTLTTTLKHEMGEGRSLVLYPFVPWSNAMVAGMTADQWRSFGATLRAVHDSALARQFAGRLPEEAFGLASAAVVRRVLDRAKHPSDQSPARQHLSAFLRSETGRIIAMLERAEELGGRLSGRPLKLVLCHADIHAANILVAGDDRILLVDWDGPLLAPRERDLLFVIGSRIARAVEPHEEGWFFQGYGEVPVNAEAIVYYRYERILEDIGEIGASVFSEGAMLEASREAEVALAESFFRPGGILETVEQVIAAWR